jgi:peptide/nickel transport system substrate-binding protein
MRRRSFLTGSAASLAFPALARADARQTIRFTPEADLAVLDPIWTTASQTTQHAFLVYDTLFGQDASYRPQPSSW